MKHRPTVTVVVLNWNGKRFVDPFMQSFSKLKYSKNKLDLLFVDNNSSDDSVEYFEDQYVSTMDNVSVVKNAGNYGYAKGNNMGIHKASGEYVLVCNNDLELDPLLVHELVNTAVDNNASAVVPKLMYLNKKNTINNAGSLIRENDIWPIGEIGANEVDEGQYDSIREITAFCGACVLFTRTFLQEVGLFDSRFFMYFEDGDLSWRGQKQGHKYFINPAAVAHHYHTGTSTEGSPLFNHYVGRNRMLILTKHGKIKILARAWSSMIKEHFFVKLKHLMSAIYAGKDRRRALREMGLSLKMIASSIYMTPYGLLKRWGMINEEKI